MNKGLVYCRLSFEALRCAFHILLLYTHRNRNIIFADIDRWKNVRYIGFNRLVSFIYLLGFFPEFRNLFYHRVGFYKHFLNFLCPQLSTLYIYTKDIGEGLFIQHGFATIISAKSIGRNCWINQQVTIGYSSKNEAPQIGDDVTINAGAKVIGGVTVGDGAILGANAVIVKDVPSCSTIVGSPARIVRRNGIRVSEAL